MSSPHDYHSRFRRVPAQPPPIQPRHILRDETAVAGLVEHVIFHNEENGFAVLKVKARGHRELIIVTGTLPEVSPGEWIEAEGAWTVDSRFGPQFKANSIRTSQPDTIEGIEKYLASGLIRGIGPVYARKLVEKFGKNVFDIIERQSALLETVDGIGPTRRARIKAAWEQQKAVREIMTFLFSHGVTTSRAFRIYKTYGESAIEKVRMDPYCLARDIHGISFQTADQIAARLGIARDSELRARAGVEYVLNELAQEGHCAFPRADLIATAERLLNIPATIVETALDHLVQENRVIYSTSRERGDLVASASLDYQERMLAEYLKRLAAAPMANVIRDAEAATTWASRAIQLTFDETQIEALRTALTSKVCVFTGGPGVGKTTLIRALVKIFGAKHQRIMLCAPTGRAAKRITETTGMEAKTIHRLLRYDPHTHSFKHNADNPLPGDVFIVDEASMIDLPLAFHLVSAIPPNARMIWVGDVDQLPSVGPGCVLHDLIASNAVPVCRLTHIFRQAARSAIVRNAHLVNTGRMPEYSRNKENNANGQDFFFIEATDPAKAADLVVRLVTTIIPQKMGFQPVNDIQVLSPMQRGELGARNLNSRLQNALNPSNQSIQRFGLTFRVGDKVMQIENNYDKDVFNGDIGRIESITEEERVINVRYDDRIVEYEWLEMDELTLAYAMTIHKSQGCEYPCVVVPLHTQHYVMLERNLLYTAITRGRRLVVLVGHPKALRVAVQRTGAHQRITTLRERLQQA